MTPGIDLAGEYGGLIGDLGHSILHVTHGEFLHSVDHPRRYDVCGFIVAGVIPHHITAATMISGFFSAASVFADYYDLVVILAPNHSGDLANVILSDRNWDIGEGVTAHRGFVEDLMGEHAFNAVVSHGHVEGDHSVGVFIPYIYHYLPNTSVAPVLLNRALSFDETLNLFHWLVNWIEASGENVLLVASIDFSHFLTPREAALRDIVTKDAVSRRDFLQIHEFCDNYLDSAAAMIIFLSYLDALGIAPQIIDHACASDFLGPGLDETTTYMIIVGTRPSRVRLTFVGDIMLHEPPVDNTYTFSWVREHLQSADLAIGNLETVFGGFFSGFPLFSAPDEFGYALRDAGFDLLSTANNHSLDQGVDGLLRSLDFLEGIGIGTFGTYRNREERDAILVRESACGMRFAFLAYTFGTNNRQIPQNRDYLVNLIRADLIRADITLARELADFVIIMPHMGFEYEPFVRQEIKDLAMMMLEAGADIVVAGHPHVVQTMGFVQLTCGETGETRRGFVAYCLGNFISSQREIPTETGVMLNLYFEMRGGIPTFVDASYISTWVHPDLMVLPVAEALQDASLNLRPQDRARLNEILREHEGLIN